MFDPVQIIRPHLRGLQPYRSARDEFSGSADIYLDANENAYGSPVEQSLNRYPWEGLFELKKAYAHIEGINPDRLFLGNGSNEAIDILIRTFCEPGEDRIMILPPTFGMYKVRTLIANVTLTEVPLNGDFRPDLPAIKKQMTGNTKIVFLCSPNNPTGNQIPESDIQAIIKMAPGLVVVDEAYISFARGPSAVKLQRRFPNLVVLRTFSKGWGLAAARLGVAICSTELTGILESVKMPYNINGLTEKTALEAMKNINWKNKTIALILAQREYVESALKKSSLVKKIYPSDANFLLVRFIDGKSVYRDLAKMGIIVRNVSAAAPACNNALRITIGTEEENERLIKALKKLENENE